MRTPAHLKDVAALRELLAAQVVRVRVGDRDRDRDRVRVRVRVGVG